MGNLQLVKNFYKKSLTIIATGAIEAILTVSALRDQFAPPTIGYKEADEDCDLDIVPNAGKAMDTEYAMSNSLGFGGHNASIIFKRVE